MTYFYPRYLEYSGAQRRVKAAGAGEGENRRLEFLFCDGDRELNNGYTQYACVQFH